jgi:hypothetical protein
MAQEAKTLARNHKTCLSIFSKCQLRSLVRPAPVQAEDRRRPRCVFSTGGGRSVRVLGIRSGFRAVAVNALRPTIRHYVFHSDCPNLYTRDYDDEQFPVSELPCRI